MATAERAGADCKTSSICSRVPSSDALFFLAQDARVTVIAKGGEGTPAQRPQGDLALNLPACGDMFEGLVGLDTDPVVGFERADYFRAGAKP